MGNLQLDSIKVGKVDAEYKTYQLQKHDFAENSSTFAQIAEETKKTDYVDDIKTWVNNGGDEPTGIKADEIIAKWLNIKDKKSLQNSDMVSIFKAINNDDFNMDGILYPFSDIKLKMFSAEQDGYGIVDESGFIYRFDKTGKFIPNKENKFSSVRDAIQQAIISNLRKLGVYEN